VPAVVFKALTGIGTERSSRTACSAAHAAFPASRTHAAAKAEYRKYLSSRVRNALCFFSISSLHLD
jgi:hypothetical protein